MKFIAAIILALGFAFNASAETIPLATVENTKDEDVSKLSLQTGSDREIRRFNYETTNRGKTIKKRSFTLSEIRKGVVLAQVRGYDVVTLRGNVHPDNGGQLEIGYLKNALTGSRRSCLITLGGSHGRFWLENVHTGKRVDYMRVVAGALGINTIENVCGAN